MDALTKRFVFTQNKAWALENPRQKFIAVLEVFEIVTLMTFTKYHFY